jgi:hypothetical protein
MTVSADFCQEKRTMWHLIWRYKRTQTRLVLSNLSEVYAEIKESHRGLKFGFSKFSSVRPTNCMLAGASRTHSVCVCTAYQNVRLMLEG